MQLRKQLKLEKFSSFEKATMKCLPQPCASNEDYDKGVSGNGMLFSGVLICRSKIYK